MTSRLPITLSIISAAVPWAVVPFAFSLDITTGTVLATLVVTIVSSLTTAIVTIVNAVRGGKERDAIRAVQQTIADRTAAIDVKTSVAATNAATAAVKALELHQVTQDINERAKEIAVQTDGQLSRVLDENKALRDLFTKVLGIMSAREGMFAGIRSEDLASSDPPVLKRPDNGSRRRAEDKD